MELVGVKQQKDLIIEIIHARINNVLLHGNFIQGPEVRELESRLEEYVGVKHCISCGNGTDALQLALMAHGIGAEDIVFTSAFSFFASAEAIAILGATPFFVDIKENTYNISPESLEKAIENNNRIGKKQAKAVIAVDLFGLPAEYDSLRSICKKHNLLLIEDAAQSFGGSYQKTKACGLADIACTSFFPAKPLGCYGDGGACFTNDDVIAEKIRSLCLHGKGSHKYDNIAIGMNSRLDTIQAAVLLEKIVLLEKEVHLRQKNFQFLYSTLNDKFTFQDELKGYQSALAQLTLRSQFQSREQILSTLGSHKIPHAIYYPKPLNNQLPLASCPSDFTPVAKKMSEEVFSIPCHAYLTEYELNKIASVLSQ